MQNTTAIIICAGEATRWQNYLGIPKHLITIEGERLLDRTVRLLKERGINDIHIVVRELNPEYEVNGTSQYIADLNPEENVDADKFLSSKELWNKEGRTLVLYGDCYFSDFAMNTIVNFKSEEWTLFCRPNASDITGTKWGECFAQSFYPQDIERHEAMLQFIAAEYKKGNIRRCGGWEHYRAMTGQNLKRHNMTTNYVEIDDWTDDFDYPQDLINWLHNRNVKEM